MKRTILAGASALALAGCGVNTLADNLAANGVTIDGEITRAEAPGYVIAVYQTYGDFIPPWIRGKLGTACNLLSRDDVNFEQLPPEVAPTCRALINVEPPA